jgi:hypothetical protein
MSDKARRDRNETDNSSRLEQQRKALDAESLQDAATLREQPEDKRDSARQTTAAGKAR